MKKAYQYIKESIAKKMQERKIGWRKQNSVLKIDKPTMVIQTNGGSNKTIPYSWVRDIHNDFAQQIVQYFVDDYIIYHIKNKDQLTLNNTIYINSENMRDYLLLLYFSDKSVLIDSFAQHATKAFEKKSVVLWPYDNIKRFGYNSHKNLLGTQENSNSMYIENLLSDFQDIEGTQLYNCPITNFENVFNLTDVINLIKQN
jgi:hypothetical protein